MAIPSLPSIHPVNTRDYCNGYVVGFACRLIIFLLLALTVSCTALRQAAVFTFQEKMIPMRDGLRLQTVILTPANQQGPLPILFRRTPYGVPDRAPEQMPVTLKELAEDGYIFVIQNLRGRFKSEGVFKLSSQVDLNDPQATNEATDAYDSIEWLIKNVPNNNGKVGMFGVSYDGLTTALALLRPHPALKAISEQASPVVALERNRSSPALVSPPSSPVLLDSNQSMIRNSNRTRPAA